MHFGAYVIFTLLAWWAFRKNRIFYYAVVSIIVYGIGLEFAQMLSPGRQLSILGVLTNILGAVILVGMRHACYSTGGSSQ